MRGIPHRARVARATALAGVVAASLLALACSSAAAAPSSVPGAASPSEFERGSGYLRAARMGKASAGWTWSVQARQWTLTSGTLPAALLARGPEAKITRGQFLTALLKIEEARAEPTDDGGDDGDGSGDIDDFIDEDGDGFDDFDGSTQDETAATDEATDTPVDDTTRTLMERTAAAPALIDAPAGSAGARAVAYGWMPSRAGKFASTAPITANEAALATASALGLRPSVLELTRRLRTEVPGARVTSFHGAQALVRTLGMRWNVKDPNDRLELGPNEAVNVAHGAYMLHVAGSQLQEWKLGEAARLAASFDLPKLGPNQARILRSGVQLIGQPYVWAGETEGRQAEGHGGFDCSGFTIRIVNGSGVPATSINRIGDRTSMAQSAIPRARRIARARLQPGDAIFFGDRGPSSTPAQNFHAGVYMGNGWFIHSTGSNGGVGINQLDGSWWGERFSWGRRALRRP